MKVTAALAFTLLLTLDQSQALKIVVIAGEDAVNIIQQKTATAPIVEVRDQNDLPVGGVPVTFTIAGQNATFAGAQTVTITSNAAGRAAVASLNPLSAGQVQINVTASVQGQTVATATITQTNFLTVAAAAAGAGVAGTAAAAAAGGGAAAGGLSGVAIAGIVGGAAAGGLVAANAAGVLGGDGGATRPCSLTVSPTTFAVPGIGGAFSVQINSVFDECEPPDWEAVSNAPFITLGPEGATRQTGRGGGVVNLQIDRNPPGASVRAGTATVAGQTVTVTQSARCAIVLSTTTLAFPSTGGSGSITVTVSPSVCDEGEWTITSADSALNAGFLISPLSGNGNGVINVTAPPNPSFSERTNAFGVGGGGQGQIVRLVQAARS